MTPSAGEAVAVPQSARNLYSEPITWAALAVLGYLLSVVGSFDTSGDAWLLQVAHRVASGEVLYRDVFFGATPLSAYLGAAAVVVFGTEILVLKSLGVLTFVLEVQVLRRIARQLRLTSRAPAAAVMAGLVYGWPGTGFGYSSLANLFFLGCFSATLDWLVGADERTHVPAARSADALVLAGALAGAAFASKQNLGAYALGAVLLSAIAGCRVRRPSPQARRAALLAASGGFTLVVALSILPVWRQGALAKFLDYAFLSKTLYLRHGGVSYLDGIRGVVEAALAPPSMESLKAVYRGVPYVLSPLICVALIASPLWAEPGERPRATAVAAFTAASLLGVFPRTDSGHLALALPALLLGASFALGVASRGVSAPLPRRMERAILAWLGVGLVYLLVQVAAGAASGRTHISTLPHFHWTAIQAERQAEIRANARTVASLAGGEAVFLLSPHAGLYYLIAGVRNPTPFDFPYVTALGRHGEDDVIAAVSRGRIRHVCLDARLDPRLAPQRLLRHVEEHMQLIGASGFCAWYRSVLPDPGN